MSQKMRGNWQDIGSACQRGLMNYSPSVGRASNVAINTVGDCETCDATKQLFGCSAFLRCEVTALTTLTVTFYGVHAHAFRLIAAILRFESLLWVKQHALLLEVVR